MSGLPKRHLAACSPTGPKARFQFNRIRTSLEALATGGVWTFLVLRGARSPIGPRTGPVRPRTSLATHPSGQRAAFTLCGWTTPPARHPGVCPSPRWWTGPIKP